MNKKVMIVDDAVFMRNIIRKNLEQCGELSITEAKDGEEAVECFKAAKPDLVLLDITMPGKSGLEVLDEILHIDPAVKIIMCSAMGQERMITKAIEKGASEFIIKPFKSEEFQKTVKNILYQ